MMDYGVWGRAPANFVYFQGILRYFIILFYPVDNIVSKGSDARRAVEPFYENIKNFKALFHKMLGQS